MRSQIWGFGRDGRAEEAEQNVKEASESLISLT